MKTQVGKFKIIGKIGTGSMGTVYEAIDPGLQRKVAIKIIKHELISSKYGEDMLKRFQHEARIISRLNHPHIVSVYEYGHDAEEGTFIAMSFAEGRTLEDYFDKQESFDLKSILRIMEQLLDALACSHKKNIVHRDIKPANIIVQNSGDIMVTDFGIARLESSEFTQVGSILGTPSYMSPEQVNGYKVDCRSDIFSSGILFYQFLTGKKPFSGSTMASIMHKILEENPIPPSHLCKTLPKIFDAIVLKSLAKKPEERYQSADDFKQDIQSAIAALDRLQDGLPEDATLVLNDDTSVGLQKGSAIDSSIRDVFLSAHRVRGKAEHTTFLDAKANGFENTEAKGTAFSPKLSTTPHLEKTLVLPSLEQPDDVSSAKASVQKHPAVINGKKWAAVLSGALLLLVVLLVVLFRGTDEVPENVVHQPSAAEPVQKQVILPAIAQIHTKPVGAMVEIDGLLTKGLTPLQADLTEGQHQLRVFKEGFNELMIIVDGHSGQHVELNLNMYPSDERGR
jgi:serine/threonine protein kinase